MCNDVQRLMCNDVQRSMCNDVQRPICNDVQRTMCNDVQRPMCNDVQRPMCLLQIRALDGRCVWLPANTASCKMTMAVTRANVQQVRSDHLSLLYTYAYFPLIPSILLGNNSMLITLCITAYSAFIQSHCVIGRHCTETTVTPALRRQRWRHVRWQLLW